MPRPFKNQPPRDLDREREDDFYNQPAGWIELDADSGMDIDVCMTCGRYYGTSPILVRKWRLKYNPPEGQVMPQLCYACI